MTYKLFKASTRRSASGVATSIYVLFVGLSLLLALFLPDQDAYPGFMNGLADVVERAVPSVRSFELVSSFPIATKMFLAAEWALVPILIAIIFLWPEIVQPNQKTLAKSSDLKMLALLAAAVALFVVYPAVIQVTPEDLSGGMLHERALRSVSESRVWMGLIGSTVIFSVAYFSALVLSYIRALVLRFKSHQ